MRSILIDGAPESKNYFVEHVNDANIKGMPKKSKPRSAARPKLGRPPLAEASRLSKRVAIKFTPGDYRALASLARDRGRTVTEIAREMIVAAMTRAER